MVQVRRPARVVASISTQLVRWHLCQAYTCINFRLLFSCVLKFWFLASSLTHDDHFSSHSAADYACLYFYKWMRKLVYKRGITSYFIWIDNDVATWCSVERSLAWSERSMIVTRVLLSFYQDLYSIYIMWIFSFILYFIRLTAHNVWARYVCLYTWEADNRSRMVILYISKFCCHLIITISCLVIKISNQSIFCSTVRKANVRRTLTYTNTFSFTQ